jgi:unsaturated rhamnogalacturonyl hydrolase
MKKIFPLLISTLLIFNVSSFAQKMPKKKALLAKMTLANGYFMKKWPDPFKPIWAADKTRPSNIWTRAVYYEGLMAFYKLNPKKEYLDYTLEWAEKHKWNLRNGTTTRNGDDQACGQIYFDLYDMDTTKKERIAAIKTTMDNMLNSDKKDDWSWVDALQMAMPVFARLGVQYKDNRYFEKMYDLYDFTKNKHGGKGLFNPEDSLWWRDKDFVAPFKTPNGKNCYWGRGNGWVVAALVRTLDIMPEDAPHRAEYLDMLKKMLTALLPHQRSDGFWNVSLYDPNDFGGKEMTGTALFVYSMAWGMNKGILDKKTYLSPTLKAWNAMSKEVHIDGRLGYVQGTGKQPSDSQPVTYESIPNFEDFGLGCFLLAGSEVYRLKK